MADGISTRSVYVKYSGQDFSFMGGFLYTALCANIILVYDHFFL